MLCRYPVLLLPCCKKSPVLFCHKTGILQQSIIRSGDRAPAVVDARGDPLERLVEEAVGALGEARLDPVDRAAEVGEAGADQERVVGDVGGLDPGGVHELREDPLVRRDRAPAPGPGRG